MAAQLISSVVAVVLCTFGAGVYFVYTEFQVSFKQRLVSTPTSWRS